MAVRLATFNPGAPDGGPDVALLMRLLSGVPHPPKMGPSDFEPLITGPNEIHFVDTDNDTYLRLVVHEEAPDVVIPYWLGPERITSPIAIRWGPVLLAGVEAVLAQWPASGPWPLYGDLPGRGTTRTARAADSRATAIVIHDFLGISQAPRRSPHNSSMYQARWTVGQVRDALVAMGV